MSYEDLMRVLAAGALFLVVAILCANVFDRPRRTQASAAHLPATPVQGAPCTPAGGAGAWLAAQGLA